MPDRIANLETMYHDTIERLIRNPESPLLSQEAAFLNQRYQLKRYHQNFRKFFADDNKHGTTSATPSITIVINTLNRIKNLPCTLKALEYQRYPQFEVVVVNGPSTDGTKDYLESQWKGRAKICDIDVANLGISRNVGISQASGDIVAFIDDDGIPESNWLSELASNYDDPSVAAVGGWVYNNMGNGYQVQWLHSKRDSRSSIHYSDAEPHIAPKPYSFCFRALIGVNSSFRRSVLYRVGGFDENYAYFLDETDLCARINDLGLKILTSSSARVHHKYAPSHLRDAERVPRDYVNEATSISYFLAKNINFDRPLEWALKKIDEFEQELCDNAERHCIHGNISQSAKKALIAGAKHGLRRGLNAALENVGTQNHHLAYYPSSRLLQFRPAINNRERKSIVFATDLYPPSKCGGIAVFIKQLASKLASHGHIITVITKSVNDGNYTIDFEDGIWVHRINTRGIDKKHSNRQLSMPDIPDFAKSFSLAVLDEIERFHDIRRFDFAFGSIWDVPLIAVASAGTIPVITEMATFYGQMKHHKKEWKDLPDYLENHVSKMEKAEIWLVKHSALVLATTNGIKNDFERQHSTIIPPQSLRIWPLGIDDIRHKHKLRPSSASNTNINILFVGRLEQRKGINDLLRAIPIVLHKCKDATFTIVGEDCSAHDTPYDVAFAQDYPQIADQNKVRFTGHMHDHDLLNEYDKCDIFVAPSEYESFGIIYLEAMRCGKPCIGTRVGGIPEVVIDGECGLLCNPNDHEDLALKILELARNDKLRKEMGERARKRFSESFTSDIMACNLIEIINGHSRHSL